MIRLYMVYNNILYFGYVRNTFYVINGDSFKIIFDRVNECNLIIHDEIVIICCSIGCYITMKISYCPVNGANPVNIRFYFRSFHFRLQFKLIYN